MKKWIFPLLVLFALTACDDNSSNNNENHSDSTQTSGPTETKEIVHSDTPEIEDEIFGYYVGKFIAVEYDRSKNYSSQNKINISIDSIRGETLYGHSVVAGNDRPFRGNYTITDEYLIVEAKEPGDDKYDGSFSMKLYRDGTMLDGSWTANDKNLSVTERSYNLKKTVFEYDPVLELPKDLNWTELYTQGEEIEGDFEVMTEDVTKINPSTTELKSSDVRTCTKATWKSFGIPSMPAMDTHSRIAKCGMYLITSIGMSLFIPISGHHSRILKRRIST